MCAQRFPLDARLFGDQDIVKVLLLLRELRDDSGLLSIFFALRMCPALPYSRFLFPLSNFPSSLIFSIRFARSGCHYSSRTFLSPIPFAMPFLHHVLLSISLDLVQLFALPYSVLCSCALILLTLLLPIAFYLDPYFRRFFRLASRLFH